jgi:hypothetical protein
MVLGADDEELEELDELDKALGIATLDAEELDDCIAQKLTPIKTTIITNTTLTSFEIFLTSNSFITNNILKTTNHHAINLILHVP